MPLNNENPIDLAKSLFPLNRSITGDGIKDSLNILKTKLPNLKILKVASGTRVFDWTVPEEWNLKSAYIRDLEGNEILNFKDNNLHIVGYSEAIDRTLSFDELKNHLHYLPNLPQAIPYVTSYYKKNWGFCLSYEKFKTLKNQKYKVKIDSNHSKGFLNYGELIIPGKTEKEIFVSTYLCHPSMANNELSGPVVATFLADWIQKIKNKKYTYRFIFIPETIGSLTYLSKNLKKMKENIIAGYNLTCIGDERFYSYLPSRLGNTLADKTALHVLKNIDKDFLKYTWKDRGSDERQYCAPGIDLPVVSIMRSKYGTYPEYHTSLDNFNLVTNEGLSSSLELMKKIIKALENNFYPIIKVLGEPQLSKRNLYPSLSKRGSTASVNNLMDLISYSDGNHDLIDIADKIDVPIWKLYEHVEVLIKHKLLKSFEKIKLLIN